MKGSSKIIDLLNKIKPPYNVSEISQRLVLCALDNPGVVRKNMGVILYERSLMATNLQILSSVEKIFPSDANFLLVKIANSNAAYKFLLDDGIVVRNRSSVELCEGCLRITIGTPDENAALIDSLQRFESQLSIV